MVLTITKFIWKFLRVDNFEEDLSTRLPIGSVANKFLSRSNMACVKSLMSVHSLSNYCTKPASLSLDKEFSKPQSNLSFRTKGLIPSFGYLNTASSSSGLMKNLMEGSSHQDSLMKAVEDYSPGSSQKMKAMPMANKISGLAAASAAACMAIPTQKACLFSSDSPVESWEDYLSDEENSNICFQEKKTSSLPILESSMPEGSCSRNSQDIVADLPVLKSSMIDSSGSRESVTSADSCKGGNQGNVTSSPVLSDSSILGVNIKQTYNISADTSECMPNSSHDSSQLYGSCSSSSDSPKCERDVKSRTNNSEPCSFKPVINLASILSAPRKTAKKGRPSSKKQKKRQREKHKHGSHSVSAEKLDIPSKSTNWLEQRGGQTKISPVLMSSPPSCSRKHSERKSVSVKESSKFCPLSQLFFKPSHSEESNEENDDDVTGAEKPVKQQWNVCISPITDACFNFALNFDSLFKQKSIPSLKGIIDVQDFTSETSSPKFSNKKFHCQSSSFSDDENFDDVDCSYSLSPSEFSASGLSNGLTLDILFTKKPPAEFHAAADPAFDQTDGQSLDGNSCQASTETDLKNVNARWEAAYPTAGYRSCQFTTEDEIKHPNIKVHFAREPYLATAHIVDSEDRAGTWHLFALDRERFERHIQEVARVVTPVLEANHRAKIQQRMQQPIKCP